MKKNRKARMQMTTVKEAQVEAIRMCLKCQKNFISTGPGNRICPNCQRMNERLVQDRILKYRVRPLGLPARSL